MNVQELIDVLLQVEDKTLKIVLEADHGQTPMALNSYGEGFVEDWDAYMMEFNDEEGYPVYVLQAL